MAPRVARASAAIVNKPKNARNKNKKRSLDAYARAQKLFPEKAIAKHRLGEVEDDEPRQKRRRDEDDDEQEDDEDEEEQPRRKRSNRRGTADDDTNMEYGSDSDGHEWTTGGLAEGEDDSDLDSDEAFGESDEERFAGFTFRGSSSGKGKSKAKKSTSSETREIDLAENEESEEDGDDSQDDEGLGLGDDAIDLAAMLDDDDDEILGGKDTTRKDMGEVSASENDEEGYSLDSESESESEDDEDDDDDDAADMELRAASMRDRIEVLDSKTRKLSGPMPPAVDVTEDDFLEGTSLARESALSKTKKKSAKPTTLAAPLPKRQQDRLNREVATKKASEQLDRWRESVKRTRRAEHLNFPLQDPTTQSGTLGKEKFTHAVQQKPQNELEESIQRIMEESGLAAKPSEEKTEDDMNDEETALLKAEELAEKKMPVEEVMNRRAQLRRARELLFREEVKAKRIAKIKSKSFRRVHRKEREREKAALESLGIDAMDEDDKEKSDRKRAEARMATKHKDSKWAKALKQTNRTTWDEGARDGVVEQARRNEELRRRQIGQEFSDDEGSDLPLSDDAESGNGNDEFQPRQLTFEKEDPSGPGSRLANHKFMRAADERRRRANEEDVERLRKEMAIADGDEVDSEAGDENIGRAIFGPSKERKNEPRKETRLEFEAPEDSDVEKQRGQEDEDAQITTEKPAAKEKARPKVVSKQAPKEKRSTAENGWLKEPEDKAKGWLQGQKSKSKRAQDVDVQLLASSQEDSKPPKKEKSAAALEPKSQSNGTADNTDGWTVVTYNDGNAEQDSSVDEDDEGRAEDKHAKRLLTSAEQKRALQQRAFAGDDIIQTTFDAEKNDMAASEDEKEISNHIPGWGSWTGVGLSKSIRKANAKAKHNPLFKTKVDGVRKADRRDAQLENVIISEKEERKGKKYLTPVLPHEFETREQYEMSRRQPIGQEWTTKEVHQKMTRPRVIVKPGVNIRALERPVA